jgi:hypothetical protein
MEHKKKLIYSVLLFILSAILLAELTLGWFSQIKENDLENITLSYNAVNISLSQGADVNLDGVPDEDENGIIYNVISAENIKISNIYPMYTTAYKANIGVTASGGYFNMVFKGISPPDESTPLVDIARAMKIKYTDPSTNAPVDISLYELLDENRNAPIISSFHMDGNEELEFEFFIYMDGNAGNEYKNKTLNIEKIILSVTQE